jgi:hypothetical protein
MPRIESTVRVNVPVDDAFVVSQSQQQVRYRWDPFVREQRLLNGASRPDVGVETFTRSRHGLTMVSRYTSFRRPSQVGMKMVKGPPFFASFGGGWIFQAVDDTTTDVVWRYTFTVKPSWIAPIADRIGRTMLQRDIDRRLAGFAAACADPSIVEAARRQLG